MLPASGGFTSLYGALDGSNPELGTACFRSGVLRGPSDGWRNWPAIRVCWFPDVELSPCPYLTGKQILVVNPVTNLPDKHRLLLAQENPHQFEVHQGHRSVGNDRCWEFVQCHSRLPKR
jgi:hypothetical protein